MKLHTPARGLGLISLTLVTGLVLTACGGHSNNDPGMGHDGSRPAVSSSAGATFNSADAVFAQSMIPHHRQAVEMANLAETRATDPEIKRLATQIKAAQDPEIATMTGWLTSWGQPTTMPGGHTNGGMHGGMPGMMSDADMAKLAAASGKEFDKQFVQMMIDHHKGAIQMAKDVQAKGSNADAKALAGRIIDSQQAEIDTMQKMLARL